MQASAPARDHCERRKTEHSGHGGDFAPVSIGLIEALDRGLGRVLGAL